MVALTTDQRTTVGYLREHADDGEVNLHRDEYGVVFDLIEDGAYMAGEINDAGEVSWY